MAQEKVGFEMEFGLKGDREVKRGMEEIIAMTARAGSAAQALTGILASAGKLLEFGAMAGPIGAAAVGIYEFGKAAYQSGENLRLVRQEMALITRTPVTALNDSDLDERTNAILAEYKSLGLDAANTFQMSFIERLSNLGIGSALIDAGASVENLFGAKLPSYEQNSPEAKNARAEFKRTQSRKMQFLGQDTAFSQNLSANQLFLQNELVKLTSRQFTNSSMRQAKATGIDRYGFGQPVFSGIFPESYQGQNIGRKLNTAKLLDDQTATDTRILEMKDRLSAVKSGNVHFYFPNTKEEDPVSKARAEADLQAKINDLLISRADIQQRIADIETDQRQADREYQRNLANWGPLRALGLGGSASVIGPDGKRHGDTSFTGHGNNPISDFIAGGYHNHRVSPDQGGFGRHPFDHPGMHPLGGVMLEQRDFLKEINKTIGKVGILER